MSQIADKLIKTVNEAWPLLAILILTEVFYFSIIKTKVIESLIKKQEFSKNKREVILRIIKAYKILRYLLYIILIANIIYTFFSL